MTDENWGVTFTPRARRDLRALDPQIRDRVLSVIDRVAARDQALDVRRLTGSVELRVRVGDWRVRFTRDVEAKLIVVQRVLPRGRAYDR
ncbi:MAG: type II toxin-antitoxin system RelE/ParE family toxin [Actinomycetota bacterium]|nr:type II toxin-antitoxin system RelE/ParE family toxin [Actinomycetota bacterium]